ISELFGLTGGYFVLRYFLALLAGGAVYLVFRRLAGRGTAALGYTLFLTSPMAIRALTTSYSDTTGVPYLTAAIAGLLLGNGSERRWAWMSASGVLFGLAIHSNPFNAGLSAIAVGVWALTEAWSRRSGVLVDLGILAGGVVVVTVAGMAYYEWRYGTGNILQPSIDAARNYSGEAGDAFRAPTYG